MHLWLEMWHQVSRTCAYAQVRLPSLPLFLSLKCYVTVSPCRSQWDFDGHFVFCAHKSFDCVSQFLCSQPGPTCCVYSIWLKISSWGEKTCCTNSHLLVRLYQFIITFLCSHFVHTLHRENTFFEVWYLHTPSVTVDCPLSAVNVPSVTK